MRTCQKANSSLHPKTTTKINIYLTIDPDLHFYFLQRIFFSHGRAFESGSIIFSVIVIIIFFRTFVLLNQHFAKLETFLHPVKEALMEILVIWI
jgi:hypothetical protein